MRSLEELEGVHEGVDAGKERAVEPSSTLVDELGDLVGHIGLALGGLYVAACQCPGASGAEKDGSIPTRLDKLEYPSIPSFRDQLPTKDAILGQVHVALLERRILTRKMLSLEIARQRSVTEFVILTAETVSVFQTCSRLIERYSPSTRCSGLSYAANDQSPVNCPEAPL